MILTAPTIFMLWYAFIHGAPSGSILLHLHLITLVILGIGTSRILLKQLGLKSQLVSAVGCVLITFVLLASWAYYLTVATGLRHWGRVVSLELLQAYSGAQLLGLLAALGLNPALVSAAFALLIMLLGTLVWRWLHAGDWTTWLPPRFSPVGWSTVALAILGIVSIRLAEFVIVPPAKAQEPIALTIFPSQFSRPLQGLGIDAFVAAEFDRAADLERQSYRPADQIEGRNVVMIVVDALRPDRMGVMGAERATTPYLSSLAAKGLISVRGNLHAVCAESACGLLAISASRFPHQFSNRPITLGDVLRAHGYQVHMILSGDHTGFYGLRELYGVTDSYHDGRDFGGYINDDRPTINFLKTLPEWTGEPMFFQIHLMSAHNLGARWPETKLFHPATNYARPLERTIDRGTNFYDNGVYQTDVAIESVLEALSEKGYLNNALIVITADHGELLGEHGLWAHAKSLYEPAVRIPFLLIPRWGHAGELSTGVRHGSQVDIAPTIVTELGIAAPSTWVGRALQRPDSERIIFMRQDHEAGLVHQMSAGNTYKYWMDIRSKSEHVFDIGSDAGENNNLIREINQEQLNRWRRAIVPVIGSVNVGDVDHSTMVQGTRD